MKTAVITVAGISSRFNKGIPEAEHVLKAVYYREDMRDTMLFHLLQKCAFADRIVVVGGYRFEELERYIKTLDVQCGEQKMSYRTEEPDPAPAITVADVLQKTILVRNDRYEDLASGYSLYAGVEEALKQGSSEVLFAEGDLDVDDPSFARVVSAERSVLTYNREPVYADRAVVLYRNAEGNYRYAFNAEHGLLSIDEAFSCLLNSGQVWKFTDMNALRKANKAFYNEKKDGTNLYIIQKYLDEGVPCSLVGFERWINCNTREDYDRITARWAENEAEIGCV